MQQIKLSEELVQEWLLSRNDCEKSKGTYSTNIKSFLRFLKDADILYVEEITESVVLEYFNSLNSKKLSTKCAYMFVVKHFLQWLTDSGVIMYNPANGISVSVQCSDRAHKRDSLSVAQCRDLLSAINADTVSGLRDRAMIALMLTTGLRTTSIADADVEDIKIHRNLVTRQDEIVLFYRNKGFCEKSKYVKISAPVAQMISEYLDSRETGRNGPLFQSCAHRNPGQRMTTRAISRICKKNLQAAGIDSDRITAHSLRHSTAIQALLNGASLEQVQDLLGHSSIDTTKNYILDIEVQDSNVEYKISESIFGYDIQKFQESRIS